MEGKRINPKISIIIPTFNRAGYLVKAIESALAQDYDNLEIIVSDNASTDKTHDVVKKYIADTRLKYFRNEKNIGMVGNWRKALNEYSTGDFFLILSDDDYLIDNKYISKAVNLIKNNSKIVIVYANGYLLYEDLNECLKLELPFNTIEDGKTIFLNSNKVKPQYFTLCNILFRRDIAIKLNAFSNEHNVCCDSEIFFKMCLCGNVGIISDFVSVYKIHSNNLIDKVKMDYSLLIGCLDYVFEPYYLAKHLNRLNANELKYWENSIIVPYLTGLLASTLLFHKEKYNETLELLKNKNNELLIKAQNDSKLKILLLLSKFKIHFITYKLLYNLKILKGL